jgi:prepilin-type N-terminal cleavage/methylation domain-containing protein
LIIKVLKQKNPDKIEDLRKQSFRGKKINKGYTLVEVLVAVAIMGIFFAAIFAIFGMVLKNSAISEARTTAVGLANQQLEMIHNLTYSDVATTTGWPQGDIPSEQIKTIDNINYTIKTEINYYDDPFDSLVPIDTLGSDYKKVKVEVTWDKYESGNPVILHTDISPRGAEEAEQPGGVLSVEVFDDSNNPVPEATINVANSNLGLNFSGTTNIEGKRLFYSVTPDSDPNFSINVSKAGFTSDYTSEITPALPDPDKPHQSVYEGEITEISFIIDLVSTLNILTQSNAEVPEPIGSIPLDLVGEKILGFDGENQPVVKNKFENVITSDVGQLTINNVEWDNYAITEDQANYDIAEINPPDPVIIDVAENQNIVISLAEHADHSLRIIVLDNSINPMTDASVRLYGGGYDETKSTSSAGQVFFTPLTQTAYTLEIQKDGYVNFSEAVEVAGQTTREISMAIQPN